MAYTVEFFYKLRDQYSRPLRQMRRATRKARRDMQGLVKDVNLSTKSLGSFGRAAKDNERYLKRLGQSVRSFPKNQFSGIAQTLKHFPNQPLQGQVARAMPGRRRMGSARGGLVGGLGGAYAGFGVGRELFQFSDTMNEVMANMRDDQKKFRAGIEKAVLKAAKSTKFNQVETGRMALEMARMGYDAKVIRERLPTAAQFATAAGINPAESIDTLTNIQDGFGFAKNARGMKAVADQFTMAFTNSPQTFHDISEAMKYATPTAIGFGVELREVNAVLMTLAKNKLKGSMAGTGFSRILEGLQKSSGPAARAFKSIGLTRDQFVDQAGNLKGGLIGLVETFEHARKRFGGKRIGEVIQRAFGARGGKAFKTLLQNLAALRENFGMLDPRKVFGRSKQASDDRMTGLAGAAYKLRSEWGALVQEFGKSGLNDDLIAMAGHLRNFTEYLSKLAPETKKWIGRVLIGFVGFSMVAIPLGILAMSVGALVSGVGALGRAVYMMLMPLRLVGAFASGLVGPFAAMFSSVFAASGAIGVLKVALGGLLRMTGIGALIYGAYLLYTNWDMVKEKLLMIWGKLKAAWASFASGLSDAWSGAVTALSSAWDAFLSPLKTAWAWMQKARGWFSGGKKQVIEMKRSASFEQVQRIVRDAPQVHDQARLKAWLDTPKGPAASVASMAQSNYERDVRIASDMRVRFDAIPTQTTIVKIPGGGHEARIETGAKPSLGTNMSPDGYKH